MQLASVVQRMDSVIHQISPYLSPLLPVLRADFVYVHVDQHLTCRSTPTKISYQHVMFHVQGDSPTKWRTEKFKMFQNGSVWRPPQCHQYTMSAAAFNANKQPVPQVETPLAAPSQATTTSAPSSHSSSSSNSSSVTQSSTAASSRKASLSNK